MYKNVTGCFDCPFYCENDMSIGGHCTEILDFDRKNFIETVKYDKPITPDWCPLIESSITVRMNHNIA